jgi:hypothetical protein
MGNKLNMAETWTCQKKHKWCIFWWLDLIIIYKIQKEIDKRYFNYSNNMIMKQLF